MSHATMHWIAVCNGRFDEAVDGMKANLPTPDVPLFRYRMAGVLAWAQRTGDALAVPIIAMTRAGPGTDDAR